jgi:Polyketide cyclase / dehydrase and lipid transport
VSELTESLTISASLAETWDHHFDPRGWPSWVDGFQAVVAGEGYPERGGTLRWRSTAAGRGEVSERVLEHAPRTLHRIAFSDPQTEGELRTTFRIEGEATRVEQTLTYRLRRGGPFSWATDRLFIRSQQRRSMQRSLLRLKHEVEEVAYLGSLERPAGQGR